MAYFEEQRLWLLARQGFTPFNVDAGIYCGGYQGPVYPNPTTLVFPGIGFDPLQYREAIATEYSGTPYVGLGIGNPGIDYRNPGHLLGIIDTFGRMSYGINVLLKTRTDENASNIPPILDFSVPMLTYDLASAPIPLAAMYPLFSEPPSQYVDGMNINTNIGRVTSIFYQTSFNPVDKAAFGLLFANKSTFSYVGLPQYFRNLISSLYEKAMPLKDKITINFYEVKNAQNFHVFFSDTSADGVLRETGSTIQENGEFVHKCEVISPTEALKMLTNENNYHDGPLPNQNDFRSMTELNSVINLIPIQTTAIRYSLKYVKAYEYSEGGGPIEWIVDPAYISPQGYEVYSSMISDVLLNIFAKQPTTIRINGTAIINPPIARITLDDLVYVVTGRERLFGGLGGFGEIVDFATNPEEDGRSWGFIKTSVTNKFGWDKVWFGLSEFNDQSTLESLPFIAGETEIPGIPGPDPDLLNNTTFIIDKTIDLRIGYNSIRIRVDLLNRFHIGNYGPPEPDSWVPEEEGNPGVLFAEWSSTNPRIVRPTIQLSYTVDGDQFSPISHEMEI